MEYVVTKTIKKSVSGPVVFTALARRLAPNATIPENAAPPFIITNFAQGIGSIQYKARCSFTFDESSDRTTVVAKVTQTPSLAFWLFIIIGNGLLFLGKQPGFLPMPLAAIGFYFYGKQRICAILDRALSEVADQLG